MLSASAKGCNQEGGNYNRLLVAYQEISTSECEYQFRVHNDDLVVLHEWPFEREIRQRDRIGSIIGNLVRYFEVASQYREALVSWTQNTFSLGNLQKEEMYFQSGHEGLCKLQKFRGFPLEGHCRWGRISLRFEKQCVRRLRTLGLETINCNRS
ncbi:hypothetical protein BDN72DRAFT_191935 [Pluteus cervinus]|uniref:Uncharacterized protein n=1 Tax=Pluteus cervinus TaxID=181527 RepID=A0ACD3AJ30_9AGAR|nr:hypothetical protein BDN72DRAFT_191935 [Pluteus cervinus]